MTTNCLRVLTAILLVACKSYCSDHEIADSLEAVLQTQPRNERFSTLYELAFQYLEKDNGRALNFITQAEQTALILGDTISIVRAKRVRATILYYQEMYNDATTLFLSTLSIATRHNLYREEIFIRNFLGIINQIQGGYDKSLTYYFGNLELAGRIGDLELKAIVLHNIAVLYYKLKDYDKALKFYLSCVNSGGLTSDLSEFVFTNIALCYTMMNDIYSAKAYVDLAQKNCGGECGPKRRMNLEYALGLIAKAENQYGNAQDHLFKSLRLAKASHDTRFQFDNISVLAEMFIQQKKFKKAEVYLHEAEKMITQGTPFALEMIKIYSRLIELCVRFGDFKRASSYQTKYIELRESVFSEELTNGLMKAEANYIQLRNREQIAAKNELIILREELISKQSTVIVLSGLLGFVATIFSIFMYRGYQSKVRLTEMLQSKVKQRTIELESSCDELQRALNQLEAAMKISTDRIVVVLKRIHGLCATGIREAVDPVSLSYLTRIDRSSQQLVRFCAAIKVNQRI